MLNNLDDVWLKVSRLIFRIHIIVVFFIVLSYHLIHLSDAQTGIIGWYFLVLVYASCFALILTDKKSDWAMLLKPDVLKPLTLIILASAGMIYFFDSRMPVFADEISQWLSARHYSPIKGAFRQQQAPLGYFYSAWSAKLLPLNLFALRWPTFVWSTTLFVVYFCFLKTFRFKTLTALLAVALLALTPEFLRYSVEGRPIFFALLFGLFLLMEITLSIQKLIPASIQVWSPTVVNLRIFALAILFLLSLGFQPPIVIFSVVVILIVINLYFKAPTLFTAGALVAAVICYLPIQWVIIGYSKNYLSDQLGQVSAITQAVTENLNKSFFMPFSYWTLMKIAIAVVFFSLIKPFRHKFYNYLLIRVNPLAIGFLVLGGFILLFSALAFAVVTNVGFKARYVIVCGLCLNISATFFIKDFLENLKFQLAKYEKLLTVILFAGVYYAFAYPSFVARHYDYRQPRLIATQIIFNHFKKDDVVVAICGQRIGCWDYKYLLEFHAGEEYKNLSENIKRPIHSREGAKYISSIQGGIFLYIEHAISINDFKIKPIFSFVPGSLFYLEGPDKINQLKQVLVDVQKSQNPKNFGFYKESYIEFEKIFESK